jgi:hypothetical protein
MQIKTTMRYHFTPVKRFKVTSADEDAKKRKPLYTVGGMKISPAIMECGVS